MRSKVISAVNVVVFCLSRRPHGVTAQKTIHEWSYTANPSHGFVAWTSANEHFVGLWPK